MSWLPRNWEAVAETSPSGVLYVGAVGRAPDGTPVAEIETIDVVERDGLAFRRAYLRRVAAAWAAVGEAS